MSCHISFFWVQDLQFLYCSSLISRQVLEGQSIPELFTSNLWSIHIIAFNIDFLLAHFFAQCSSSRSSFSRKNENWELKVSKANDRDRSIKKIPWIENWTLANGQSMQVFSMSTLLSGIALHLLHIWLQALVGINSEQRQKLFPSGCYQAVLLNWNLGRHPFLG